MLYGKDWKKMQPLIKTRTLVQIRTHAQKVFKKIGFKKISTAKSRQPMHIRPMHHHHQQQQRYQQQIQQHHQLQMQQHQQLELQQQLQLRPPQPLSAVINTTGLAEGVAVNASASPIRGVMNGVGVVAAAQGSAAYAMQAPHLSPSQQPQPQPQHMGAAGLSAGQASVRGEIEPGINGSNHSDSSNGVGSDSSSNRNTSNSSSRGNTGGDGAVVRPIHIDEAAEEHRRQVLFYDHHEQQQQPLQQPQKAQQQTLQLPPLGDAAVKRSQAESAAGTFGAVPVDGGSTGSSSSSTAQQLVGSAASATIVTSESISVSYAAMPPEEVAVVEDGVLCAEAHPRNGETNNNDKDGSNDVRRKGDPARDDGEGSGNSSNSSNKEVPVAGNSAQDASSAASTSLVQSSVQSPPSLSPPPMMADLRQYGAESINWEALQLQHAEEQQKHHQLQRQRQ